MEAGTLRNICSLEKSTCEKSLFADQTREADPTFSLGKADDAVKGNRREHTVYRRGTGSSIQGKFSGITSGSCRGQQGLVTTCKDSPNEAKSRRRREPNGSGA